MKKLQSSAIIFAIALVAFGCNKEERILFRKDGDWKTTKETQQWYYQGILVQTDNDIHTTEITFKKDGSGTAVVDGTTEVISWTINDEGDELRLCSVDGSISTCSEITLVESTKDKQVWHSEFSDTDYRIVYDYELVAK